MDKYQVLGLVGEGSYGVVTKCRNKDNGQIVAVKKFLESDDDAAVRKIALREMKLLKQLRHENLVNLLDVCKRKKRWYLVFEFVDHTVLDDLEESPSGLDFDTVRKYLFQIMRAIAFCHSHNIIHRDIKPENILVSQSGVVKLCDFGFARPLASPGEVYTDYVATRWYRAPELLVGDSKYGRPVDVWAIGSLITEMLTGEALFPGDSDIDQLFHITKCLGNLIPRQQELFYKNPLFAGMKLPEVSELESLEIRYPKLPPAALDLAKECLQIDPDKRPSCAQLLQGDFFNKDGFAERFTQELKENIQKDVRNYQFQKKPKIIKRDKYDVLEERKMISVQDFSMGPRRKEGKLIKTKPFKPDAEKADQSSKLGFYDSAIKPFKFSPQTNLKDSSSSLDCAKNLGTFIPPINQNFSPTFGIGSGPGSLGYRLGEKSKKYMNPLLKARKPSPVGRCSVILTPASKKKWEFSKTDTRLPELNHLPELRGAEARHPRFVKKENRMFAESRVPSLAAIDLHNSSLASQQLSGTLMPDASEANFPRVEH
ncbi:PREDICTED: cyclin-dependent kinase-like 2 [Pseudopodoces humilis]|uniref:cyclin-dependent kinase-like 2 n=1 Tax=Pseudopodoces humilis TaxID=181119 RepID=UPI0006B6DA02|nr:PREDICTED: cyclin-dependent kinase-like 2 [Pseudopodoces humilis]XP_014116233.1 PREDICTED: cyclin-dependent kinase-like 2 [Pseudopodoces humilis]